jgi:FixJ family two-component response regulator
MRMQAMKAGAMDFLAKPFDDEALLESVRAAMAN